MSMNLQKNNGPIQLEYGSMNKNIVTTQPIFIK